MSRQTKNVIFRGSPEQKLIKQRDDFSGGINMRDSDDLMDDDQIRYGYNMTIDEQGDIKSRKGWKELASAIVLDKMSSIKDFDIGQNSPVADLNTDKFINRTFEPGERLRGTLGNIPVLTKGEKLYFRLDNIPDMFVGVAHIALYEGSRYIGQISNTMTLEYTDTNRSEGYFDIHKDFRQTINDKGEVLSARLELDLVNSGDKESISSTFRADIWREKPVGEPSDVSEILAFEIVENTNNLWNSISNTKYDGVLPDYNEDYGSFGYVVIRRKNGTIEIIGKRYEYKVGKGLELVGKSLHNLDRLIKGSFGITGSTSRRIDQPLQITSIDLGKDGGKMYFTVNDVQASNLVSISYDYEYNDKGVGNKLLTLEYFGKIYENRETNSAYKPTPQEIRHVGFNMLGDVPLTWVDSSGLNTNSIQGVFLTNITKDIPLSKLPMTNKFRMNVMYTGDLKDKDFGIKFFEVVGYDEKEKAPKRNEIKAELNKVTTGNKGMYVVEVTLKTAPTQEVEIEVEFPEDPNVGKYYDYYSPGSEDPDAEEVRSLNIGDFEIVKVWDRFVYYKDNTMWYNDINRPDYIPNFNYIKLPLDAEDSITGIVFFRSAYIIFTKKKIFKMQGNFAEGVGVTLVNDTLGCIAPKTIKMINNRLIFLSGHGLFSLKSELFRQDLENVERLDAVIPNVIPRNAHAHAYVDGDEYVLLLNNQRPRLQNPYYNTSTSILGRSFRTPDVIRYYAEDDAFMFDVYNNKFPWFIFEFNGEMFGIAEGSIFKEKTGTLDFGEAIPIYLETQGMDFDFPTHEKKYKKMTVKLGVDSFLEDITFDFYVDGNHSYEKIKWNTHLYDEVDLANSRHLIERFRIPSRKGKNLAIIMTANTKKQVSLKALSFEYKLGKIRE